MVENGIIDQMAKVIGRPIVIEALATSDAATNLPVKCYESTYFDNEYPDQTAWLAPSPNEERNAILCYLNKKRQHEKTSAVIIVPASANGKAQPWLPLLKGMSHIRRIEKPEKVWRTTDGKPVPIKRAADIYWDAPCEPAEVGHDPLERETQAMCTMRVDMPDMIFASQCSREDKDGHPCRHGCDREFCDARSGGPHEHPDEANGDSQGDRGGKEESAH